jgi:2-polyprenyl-3-methyl-5-hydroxy-6-metoxy-1,4-benzoquinol methylase
MAHDDVLLADRRKDERIGALAAVTLQEYYEEYWGRETPSPLDDPLRPTRLRLLREELARTSARRVLDVGCGAGDLVATLAADGIDASGFDISPRAVELAARAHPECNFAAHSVEDLPWPLEVNRIDVVVAFEVIEHLVRPRRLLEGARGTLTQGGYLALTTPYHGRVKNLALALLAFDHHFAVEGDHIRFFTDRGLRRLLEETGFRIERVAHFGRFPGLWAGVFVWARKR